MARVQSALRVSVSILTWLSGALMLVVPLWFAVAAFGAKWNFIDWRFALDIMVHQAGFTLLLTALVTGVLGLIMIAIHRVVMREWFGVIMAPAVAIIIAGVGLGWAYTFEEARSSLPVLLDVTTDTADPPHFSANTRTRRNAFGVPIDYAAHRGEDGRPYAQIQLETYPLIASWDSDQTPQDAYSKAIRTARYMGLHIGAASETAGMFEATDEEFWFGFRDDIIVRVRETELGGVRIDIRSIARQPVNDLGRNARRVQEFLTLLDEDELVY
ncbi:MAG: DUF1499 domain-containing protein [Alphaproteobacteria bacterium]|nr:DUF1499 domain-containing protein [Alphaproteobacteria bacterium]